MASELRRRHSRDNRQILKRIPRRARYSPDPAYSLQCLNHLVLPLRVARPTTLLKNLLPCFLPGPRLNSSPCSTSSSSISANEMPPAEGKRCCACAPMKSCRAWSARARSRERSRVLPRNIRESRRDWSRSASDKGGGGCRGGELIAAAHGIPERPATLIAAMNLCVLDT